MTGELRALARQPRAWGAVVVVLACLVGGLHSGDVRASDAARRETSLSQLLQQRERDVRLARVRAETAERSAVAARRRTARAALEAHLAGVQDAAALLPAGMRFACLDRARGRCVVVEDRADRAVTLVWPAYRPDWGAGVGLPQGACDGMYRSLAPDRLSVCERFWLRLSASGLAW